MLVGIAELSIVLVSVVPGFLYEGELAVLLVHEGSHLALLRIGLKQDVVVGHKVDPVPDFYLVLRNRNLLLFFCGVQNRWKIDPSASSRRVRWPDKQDSKHTHTRK